jgi:TPR repeat protein
LNRQSGSAKLTADGGDAAAQVDYGISLMQGLGTSIDLVSAARYFKLAADQRRRGSATDRA